MERIQKIYQPPVQEVIARTEKEDLINQIAAATNENTPALRKRLALATNTLGWTETDLHALLKKKEDPTIRNYTAFVKFMARVNFKKI
jgi:hypothetical protein